MLRGWERRIPTAAVAAVTLVLSFGTAHAWAKDNGAQQAPGALAHQAAAGDNSSPQPASNADFSGNGANVHGAYDSTRNGSPSLNGNGDGKAVGQPCAGCVGKADNKNPAGQKPLTVAGLDINAGYECDRNRGIGQSNPAHTSCTPQAAVVASPVTATPTPTPRVVVGPVLPAGALVIATPPAAGRPGTVVPLNVPTGPVPTTARVVPATLFVPGGPSLTPGIPVLGLTLTRVPGTNTVVGAYTVTAPPTGTPVQPATLATTGLNLFRSVAFGIELLVAGTAALVVSRRRREDPLFLLSE